MKKIISFIFGTYLTLTPSPIHAEEIISYKANKKQACLEFMIKETKVKLCDGINGDRDDVIDDISYDFGYLERVCIDEKFDFKRIRDNLVKKHVKQFNNILNGTKGEIISFDLERKYLMAEADNYLYYLSANRNDKTKKFYVTKNGFALAINHDPFTKHLVSCLYKKVLETVNE